MLETLADIASIATAVMAVIFFLVYHCRRCHKRRKLEEYLRRDKANAKPPLKGRRTVVHLMAKLKYTEDEVYMACFDSKHIVSTPAVDPDTMRATEVLFEYDDET